MIVVVELVRTKLNHEIIQNSDACNFMYNVTLSQNKNE